MRLSPVPVLLVKTPGTNQHPVVLAAIDPGHTFSKPAKLEQRILAASSTIESALRGTQHILHANAPFPLTADPETMLNQETVERLQAAATAAAQKALYREMRATRNPRAQRQIVGRLPAYASSQTAKDTRSSIVVMGAVSRSG